MKLHRYERVREEVLAIQWTSNINLARVISRVYFSYLPEISAVIRPGDWIVIGDFGVQILDDSEFHINYKLLEKSDGKKSNISCN